MIDRHQDDDARLARLREATRSIRARGDFAARVAAAVARDADPVGWWFDLGGAACRILPVAALAAALGIVWAAASERAQSDTSVTSNHTELDAEW